MANFQKTVQSEDGERRAVIMLRPDGNFFVSFQVYDDQTVASTGGLGDPFWRVAKDGVIRHSEDDALAVATSWAEGGPAESDAS